MKVYLSLKFLYAAGKLKGWDHLINISFKLTFHLSISLWFPHFIDSPSHYNKSILVTEIIDKRSLLLVVYFTIQQHC